jgi:hypothetical protein
MKQNERLSVSYRVLRVNITWGISMVTTVKVIPNKNKQPSGHN